MCYRNSSEPSFTRGRGKRTGSTKTMLDTLRVAADDLRDDNAAALLAGLENPSLERIAAQMTALRRRLSAHELAALREVMLLWAQQVARRRIGLDLEVNGTEPSP